jgi:hypothetical protein
MAPRREILAYFAALMVLFAPALAVAEQKPFLDLPDEKIAMIMQEIRPQLHKAKISDTEYLGEETPEELADPLLTTEQGEEAFVRGVASITAEWCGIDWANLSYKPFMAELRARGYTPKQMAYVGFLHGAGMGTMKKKYEEKPCPDQIKQRIAEYLIGP